MKRLWLVIGKLGFWLSWPVQRVVLPRQHRTRVIIAAEDKVLVVRGWIGTGQWELPGGGVHKREDLVQAAIREVREETGLELQPKQLTKLFEMESQSYKLPFTFTCFSVDLPEPVSAKGRQVEIVDTAWLKPQNITKSNATANTYNAVQSWMKSRNLL